VADHLGHGDLRKAGVTTGYHTRWACPPGTARGIRSGSPSEALAFGKAVYDQPRALGLSVAGLAGRADTTTDEIECTEEGGTEPAIALLRRLATALDAAARLTAGHDLGPARFEPHAARAVAIHEGTLMVDIPVIVRHQDRRGALCLDHRHDQALCRRRLGDLIFDHRHDAQMSALANQPFACWRVYRA
jgi:transcriptional regulator with XRE-family HTH domain